MFNMYRSAPTNGKEPLFKLTLSSRSSHLCFSNNSTKKPTKSIKSVGKFKKVRY